jgi:hypothetical protein
MLRISTLHVRLLISLASIAGCGGSEPLRISKIQIGRSLNPDRTVADHTALFKPTDTVYVAVLTADRGAGKISVRWRYAGRIVDEPEKEVSYWTPAATEFHLQNPIAFPEGDYEVEIFVNDQPVGKRAFRVDS